MLSRFEAVVKEKE